MTADSTACDAKYGAILKEDFVTNVPVIHQAAKATIGDKTYDIPRTSEGTLYTAERLKMECI